MDSIESFRNRLQKNLKRRRKRFHRDGIYCFRVYDRDIPAFPLTIDVYEDALLFSIYEGKHGVASLPFDELMDVSRVQLGIEKDRVFQKTRRRRVAGQQHEKLNATNERFSVRESNLQFWVNLRDYTDTGLFLDHRNTRAQVRTEALGKRVLNLFSYTGSFSVYALAGGADQVTSVDVSGPYLRWAEDNIRLNQLRLEKARFIRHDVKEYLEETWRNNERFDLIIIDPPTASKSKRAVSDFDIQRDYVALLSMANRLLTPGGCIFFSTNFQQFQFDEASIDGVRVTDMTHQSVPEDFRRSPPPHRCWRLQQT